MKNRKSRRREEGKESRAGKRVTAAGKTLNWRRILFLLIYAVVNVDVDRRHCRHRHCHRQRRYRRYRLSPDHLHRSVNITSVLPPILLLLLQENCGCCDMLNYIRLEAILE